MSTPPIKRELVYKTVPSGDILCDVWAPPSDAPSFSDGCPILLFTRMSGFMAFNKDIAGPHWAWSGTKRG